MTELDEVNAARRRLAEVETVEEATELIDDIEQLREYCRLIDAAPARINEITLVKVETRQKRADLVDEGQAKGTIAKAGRPKIPQPVGEFRLASQRVAEDRVLRDTFPPIVLRRYVDEATDAGREIIEKNLLDKAWRLRRQTVDGQARTVHLGGEDRSGDGWILLAGTMKARLGDIPDGSVDLIVTDPPYPAENLNDWSQLGEQATRVLAPKAILVALSGKIGLPAVIDALQQHLSYGWVYCERMTSGSTRILARRIGQEWKPWLAFSNGQWPSGRIDWHGDMLTDAPRSKALYHWEQAEAPAGALVAQLSPLNGIVLDPFCGTGTYGVAALRAGRQFIGVEADADRLQIAAQRLESWQCA